MVFDVNDRQSFDALDSWVLEMQNEIGNQSEMDNVVVCVCANKVHSVFKVFHGKLVSLFLSQVG